LHPIAVTPDGRLIAGERRLLAFKHLGKTEIPVHVVDLDQIVRGEFAENEYRKSFMASELHGPPPTGKVGALDGTGREYRQRPTTCRRFRWAKDEYTSPPEHR
jgi:hypothetical protein